MAFENPEIFFSDFNVKSSVQNDLRALKQIYDAQLINDRKKIKEPSYEGNLMRFVIHLNDLLQKLRIVGMRISWTDDVPQNLPFGLNDRDRAYDITNFIRWLRNLLGHPETRNVNVGSGEARVNVLVGASSIVLNGATIENPYPNDLGINYGPYVILMSRHLMRLYHEVMAAYKGLPGNPFDVE